jgi:hypothetical protein
MGDAKEQRIRNFDWSVASIDGFGLFATAKTSAHMRKYLVLRRVDHSINLDLRTPKIEANVSIWRVID